MYQTNMVYTLNLYNVTCHIYSILKNKTKDLCGNYVENGS